MFHRVNGNLLLTVSMGDGPNVLVAHGGWTGSWELWLEPFELLTATGAWRCVSYDHLGTGESPVDPAEISAERLAADLIGVMDALGVERAVIAGESLGASVVLDAYFQRPERFTGMVLVDGSPPRVAGPPVPNPTRDQLVAGSRSDYAATVAAFVDACVPEPDSDHIRRWGRDILLRAAPEAAARLLECQGETGLPPHRLGDVKVPALVIHGSADRIIPVAAGRQVAAALPEAELVILEGIGHVPTMTSPKAVAEAIRARFER